jgi:hypothetical protein
MMEPDDGAKMEPDDGAKMEPDDGATGDLGRLELAMRLREFHHNAIWEGQKHFTWFMSILLSAQLLVLTSDTLSSHARAILVVIASSIGILLAITGFRVQRREGLYWWHANSVFVQEHNAVYPDRPITASAAANKSLPELLSSFIHGQAGVRDYFQVLFLGFVLVFLGLIVYGVLI